MKKEQALFDLIHSLTASERRYFHLQMVSNRKNSNLLRLFEVISNQKNYDENEINETFKGEKFLSQLHVTRNHLYEAILKHMRSFDMEKTIDYRIKGMIQDVKFLFEKRLFNHCKAAIKRAIKFAERHEKYHSVLELLEWKAQLLSFTFYNEKDESDIDEISEQYYETLEKLQNIREYSDLQSRIFNNFYKIGTERKNENYKTNDQIVNQFALKDINRALTFKSLCCYYNIHAIYRKINNDWQGAYDYRSQLLELIRNKKDKTEEHIQMLFGTLNNLLPICLKLEKYDLIEAYLEEIREIPDKYSSVKVSDNLRMKIFTQSYVAELGYFVRIGEVDRGLEAVEQVKLYIKEREDRFRKFPQLHLYYNISYFFFSIKEYSKSLQWLNKILNDNSLSTIEDLHSSSRILNLLLQYELEKDDFMEYLTRSTYRYLYKLEGLYNFEKILLNFLKKNTRFDSLEAQAKAFKKLKSQLEDTRYEPGERNALSTLDLIAWVESKIEQEPFYVIKQRQLKN